jgi:hypothetical protein
VYQKLPYLPERTILNIGPSLGILQQISFV